MSDTPHYDVEVQGRERPALHAAQFAQALLQ